MDFTDKYTNNSDERRMLRRIADMLRKSEKTYTVLYTGFLTPAQQTLISSADEFYGKISFCGGYDDAERRICRVCADEYASDEGLPAVLFRLTVSSPGAEISHRDILGSLMGAGIKREMIGDIMTNQNKAQFFCHDSEFTYEICFMFMNCEGYLECPSHFAHEMLHTFGVPDLYTAVDYGITQEYVDYAANSGLNDIMRINDDPETGLYVYDSIPNEVTDITAYYAGLTDYSETVNEWGFAPSQH